MTHSSDTSLYIQFKAHRSHIATMLLINSRVKNEFPITSVNIIVTNYILESQCRLFCSVFVLLFLGLATEIFELEKIKIVCENSGRHLRITLTDNSQHRTQQSCGKSRVCLISGCGIFSH